MPTEENLTYLQKVALKGEVGFALSTSAHDAEIKFRTYLILKEVEDKFKPFIIECVKEGVTFDETIIDRIYLEVINNSIPVWLWIEEVIADIKLHLAIADAGLAGITGSKLSINKVQERKNLIESAFVLFAREALILSPDSAEQLFEEILNDYDLEFLHNACFYLKSCCPEIKDIRKQKNQEIPEELMSCLFDIKKILSFAVETKALNTLNKIERQESRQKKFNVSPISTKEINGEIIAQGSFTIDNTITHEELSQYISEKIAELFEGHTHNPSQDRSNTVYVVRKVFTDSGLSTNIRTCQTKEEAINFIKKIVREYPELTNTCEFQVHTEKKHEREKNQWNQKKT